MSRWKEQPPKWALFTVCIPSRWVDEILQLLWDRKLRYIISDIDWKRIRRNERKGRGFNLRIRHPDWKSPRRAWGHENAQRHRRAKIRGWRKVFITMMDAREENDPLDDRAKLNHRLTTLNQWAGEDIVTQLAALAEPQPPSTLT